MATSNSIISPKLVVFYKKECCFCKWSYLATQKKSQDDGVIVIFNCQFSESGVQVSDLGKWKDKVSFSEMGRSVGRLTKLGGEDQDFSF